MSGKLFQKDDIPTTSIKAELAVNIQQEIIDKILEIYPDIEYLKLGSVSKKEGYNGDIDIGVKAKDIDELANIIHKVFDYTDTVENKSLYIISIKYPYKDNEKQKYVAVDFILIIDVEYTKFRYYCPNYINKESKYKVGTKIMFIGIILNHCKDNELKSIKDISVKYEFLPTGLYLDLYERTTGLNVNYLVTRNPQEVVNIMFDNKTPEVCNTLESLWGAIHSNNFKYPKELKAIELSFFINSYRKCWEEQVKPEDFKLQYWTSEEIREKFAYHKRLRDFNKYLCNI